MGVEQEEERRCRRSEQTDDKAWDVGMQGGTRLAKKGYRLFYQPSLLGHICSRPLHPEPQEQRRGRQPIAPPHILEQVGCLL